jgi:predicted ATP-dependent protease
VDFCAAERKKQKLKFIPVENVDEVLAAALEKNEQLRSAGSVSRKPTSQ